VVFDRFLARIEAAFGAAATLKGGLVLELRLARARTTKDVDLRLVGTPEDVLAKLQDAGRRDLGDFMIFEVVPDEEHPDIQNDGIPYDGLRFRAECKLGGIAEKLHAYTMPRPYPNSRVKDLPDLALLATAQPLEAKRLRAALEQTFAFRKTHPLPANVPDPLPAWASPYAAMAREDQLAWPTLVDVASAARAFLDPVLGEDMDATWDPDGWCWRSLSLGGAALC
jgi:hypothetical protein